MTQNLRGMGRWTATCVLSPPVGELMDAFGAAGPEIDHPAALMDRVNAGRLNVTSKVRILVGVGVGVGVGA